MKQRTRLLFIVILNMSVFVVLSLEIALIEWEPWSVLRIILGLLAAVNLFIGIRGLIWYVRREDDCYSRHTSRQDE